MCFLNLFNCSWSAQETFKNQPGFPYREFEDNISIYDVRTRNRNFVSPEQMKLFEELTMIAMSNNGKINVESYEI